METESEVLRPRRPKACDNSRLGMNRKCSQTGLCRPDTPLRFNGRPRARNVASNCLIQSLRTTRKTTHGLSRAELFWMRRIQHALSVDLLKPKYRKLVSRQPRVHYVTGHCYIATEAAYYLFAKNSGFNPRMVEQGQGVTHWWLYHTSRDVVLDITAAQGVDGFDYRTQGRAQPFQKHGTPSRRALQLMIRVLLMNRKTSRSVLDAVYRELRQRAL